MDQSKVNKEGDGCSLMNFKYYYFHMKIDRYLYNESDLSSQQLINNCVARNLVECSLRQWFRGNFSFTLQLRFTINNLLICTAPEIIPIFLLSCRSRNQAMAIKHGTVDCFFALDMSQSRHPLFFSFWMMLSTAFTFTLHLTIHPRIRIVA